MGRLQWFRMYAEARTEAFGTTSTWIRTRSP